MKEIENKKIPIITIIILCFTMLVTYINKEPMNFASSLKNHKQGSNDLYILDAISIFGCHFKYRNVISFLLLLLTTAIILYLFKNDKQIIHFTKNNIAIKFVKTSIKKSVFFYSYNNDQKPIISEITIRKPKSEISTQKDKSLIVGIVFLLLFILEYRLLITGSSPTIFAIILIIFQKFYGAYLCSSLSKYNIGGSWFWYLFGFTFPSVALITAGSNFTLKNKYK